MGTGFSFVPVSNRKWRSFAWPGKGLECRSVSWRDLEGDETHILTGIQYYKPDGGYMVLVSLGGVQIPCDYPFPPQITDADGETKMCWFLINESKQFFPCSTYIVPY
jgi:hypothetical protein